MISRRLKSINPRPESRKLMNFETEEITSMNSSIEPTNSSVNISLYCCIAKGRNIMYRYNNNGHELESLATICLEHTPPHHKWQFHTVGNRTFGYLLSDNCTYFAIVDPTLGSMEILNFLERVRQVFVSVPKRGLESSLLPIMTKLIDSIRKLSRNDGSNVGNNEIVHESAAIDVVGSNRNGEDRILREMERSLSSTGKRSVWWRHVKIVVAVDAIVCLILFGVWLGICKGFDCVSNR